VALPDYISERDGSVYLEVRLTPGASSDAIVGERGGQLAVRVSARAVQGRANERLRKLVARTCGVPKGRVEIVRGTRARRKLVRIDGVPAREVARLLARVQG
jgi:uncharacterized protein (TIGR00251 family)